MRDEPLLSQVFLEIGETGRLKLFALSAGDVVRTGAAHERCHIVKNHRCWREKGANTGVVFPRGKKSFFRVPPGPVPTQRPPGGEHGLPLEIQDSQRDGEILGNSGLGKF